MTPLEGPLLRGPFETLYRSAALPFRVGDEVRQCGATYRVTAVTAGRPSKIDVVFERPLDEPGARILVWKDGALGAFSPPPVGASSEVAWFPGPLGAF